MSQQLNTHLNDMYAYIFMVYWKILIINIPKNIYFQFFTNCGVYGTLSKTTCTCTLKIVYIKIMAYTFEYTLCFYHIPVNLVFTFNKMQILPLKNQFIFLKHDALYIFHRHC